MLSLYRRNQNTLFSFLVALGMIFLHSLKLQLHDAIYRPDSFVMMLRYCANLKAIRYESTSLNRIAADKSHRVIVALLKCVHWVLAHFSIQIE